MTSNTTSKYAVGYGPNTSMEKLDSASTACPQCASKDKIIEAAVELAKLCTRMTYSNTKTLWKALDRIQELAARIKEGG